MGRLILDTGVLVAVDRGRVKLSDIITEADDVVISAVTVAELDEGLQLADDSNRARRQAFMDGVLEDYPVEPYDVPVARAHAKLMAHCRMAGQPRGAHDLMIAATAAETGRTLITMDARAGFGDLPGITAKVLPR
ncbi:PIN domain-containing protein [Streptomyces boninensis]|uniref:PIN domain-containing protein n=1 Tax=Streptomyces boninensis TaxID=2039455 RepID=UPI003B227AB5